MKKFLLLCPILFSVCSCATIPPTRPNFISICQIQNPGAKALMREFIVRDFQLALEVGRLPEVQEGMGESQIRALTRFMDLVSNASYGERNNIASLLKIGKPAVRRYSTPLQAIFWVLEKEVDANILQYSLEQLLDKAWDFSGARWEDYDTVIERLNSPRLVDYYERKRFVYGLRTEHPGDPRWLFKTNCGMCDEISYFAFVCLKKAGYEVTDHNPTVAGRGLGAHHVTLFRSKSGNLYIMDNGRPDKKGIVKYSDYSLDGIIRPF